MIQIKISGETPKSGPAICHTCKNASIAQGQNCEERIICRGDIFNSTKGVVTFRVAQCGSYHPKNQAWLYEMEEMAWKIEARKRGSVGFSDPDLPAEMDIVITKPSRNKNYGAPE
jgi:hypothetical protein